MNTVDISTRQVIGDNEFPVFRKLRLYKRIIRILKRYRTLYLVCRKSQASFFRVVLSEYFYQVVHNKKMWLHSRATIRGIRNIETHGQLSVGINFVGFVHKFDRTYINVRGKLIIHGNVSIGRGCRMDIGPNGRVEFGNGSSITANSTFIIMHELIIGENCAISWDCQFLDEDFHEVLYWNKKTVDSSIRIGNNVWIGCGVKIYKGSVIPDGCIIASNSVVKGMFSGENTLIGGIPATVIREGVSWK